jgi:hypothetical protein
MRVRAVTAGRRKIQTDLLEVGLYRRRQLLGIDLLKCMR